MEKLDEIVVSWSKEIGMRKKVDESICERGGGIQLKIFGSTRLGVHTPDADIDVLCIAPSFISRNDFFTSFCELLTSRTDVSMVSSIPEAYTPVLKFNIDGQPIDMIFVSIAMHSLPSDINVLDANYLRTLDEQGVRSLNGSRVAECICRLVPNFQTFCMTLRVIKHWARQRGLYSNVLGFLGGVNFAILVAFVCQRYINACPATLVRKFFLVYTQWRWPNPILLTVIEDRSPFENDGRYLPIWNPKLNPKDGAHLMPIITPAYPSMNSAYNVGIPQFRCLQEEFQRGQIICQNYRSVEGSTRSPFPWTALCDSSGTEFFQKYPRYIQIDIAASTAEAHRSWFSWGESRLRLLILSLEQPPCIFCHPQANCFYRTGSLPDTAVDPCDPAEEHSIARGSTSPADFITSFFIGLSFRNGLREANLTPSIQDFLSRVNNWDLRQPGTDLSVWPLLSSSLPAFVFEQQSQPSAVSGCTPVKQRSSSLLASEPTDLAVVSEGPDDSPEQLTVPMTEDSPPEGAASSDASPVAQRTASPRSPTSPPNQLRLPSSPHKRTRKDLLRQFRGNE